MVVATNNPGKLREIRRLAPTLDIHSPAELGARFHYEESGASFLENAFGKARSLYQRVLQPVLADDSGLAVAALGGEPGVYSARYGASGGASLLSDTQRNEYLLKKLSRIDDRGAAFVCCMVLLIEEDVFLIAQETLSGEIARSPRGSNGFGYDPVFFVPSHDRTVAELDDAEKDAISHRGRATRAIMGLVAQWGRTTPP